MKVVQPCLTLHGSMDCIVHGILQAKILEWVAFPFSRGSSQPRDRTQVSHIAGSFFTSWATREAYLWMEGSMNVTFLRACENGDTVTVIISDYGFVHFSQYLLGYFVLFSVLWDCMIKCVGFFFFFCPTTQHVGILVPWPGIEPMPPAVEAQSSNQWTAREFP